MSSNILCLDSSTQLSQMELNMIHGASNLPLVFKVHCRYLLRKYCIRSTESKLQGNMYYIVNIANKQQGCCTVYRYQAFLFKFSPNLDFEIKNLQKIIIVTLSGKKF
jgi:hypothetical protein